VAKKHGVSDVTIYAWRKCTISRLGTGRFLELGTTVMGSPAEP
jgi:transposase-like protein